MRTRLGDVVIWRLPGLSACNLALIREDNERLDGMGGRWRVLSEREANSFAQQWIGETGGRILEWDGFAEPHPRQ